MILLWWQRNEVLSLEFSDVEDLIDAEKEHGYAYFVDFWTQRRRAILTEIRAIEALLARVDGRVVHDQRKRDPRRVEPI